IRRGRDNPEARAIAARAFIPPAGLKNDVLKSIEEGLGRVRTAGKFASPLFPFHPAKFKYHHALIFLK
ncbi:MAG: hypothetical protein Q7T24_06095, partial [Deltaproteobacteria bacterium]|nr:hypothetical protein [Deltaproteobacteria bacterium]